MNLLIIIVISALEYFFSFCLKDCRLIREMVKFCSFPIKYVFDIINELMSYFKFKRIECLDKFQIIVGRYIYLNKATHQRFGQILDSIKKFGT